MPISPEAEASGIYVLNAGFTVVPPNSPYPLYQHPKDHHFTWDRGRTVSGYCVVYITRGEGVFDSTPSGLQAVHAGDILIAHPRIWHRYRPLTETGWDEYWVEFAGDHADRLMRRKEFGPDRPIHRVGLGGPLLDLFLSSVELLREEPPEFQLLLGSLATQVIARVLSALKKNADAGAERHDAIREAKRWLASRNGSDKGLEKLAARLNMSYSSFRHLFKAETGFSPGQFAIESRLRRAEDLLVHTDATVSEIARECNMESIYYFSRLFKKRNRCSPTTFRQVTRAGKVARR